MPAYYLSIEGIKTGEKSDPATDRLVTLQYQKIDLTTGETLDVLVILREWECSEKEIVTTFYNQFFRPGTPVTQFIPVGLNLDYTYEMLLALFRKYGLAPPTSYELYYQRPRFDLRPIIILLNNGRFAGASLDAFTLKKGEDRHMEKWYDKKEFGRIEHYVREEATRFLKVLQYLSRNKSRMGITLKEAHAAKQTPLSPPLLNVRQRSHPPGLLHARSGRYRGKQLPGNLYCGTGRPRREKRLPTHSWQLPNGPPPKRSGLPQDETSLPSIRQRRMLLSRKVRQNAGKQGSSFFLRLSSGNPDFCRGSPGGNRIPGVLITVFLGN